MIGEESAVEAFARALWGARKISGGRIETRSVASYGRTLTEACMTDVRASDGYDPEADARVLWAREVLAQARRREPMCRACGELEAMTAFLLKLQEDEEPCGKDRAAGD